MPPDFDADRLDGDVSPDGSAADTGSDHSGFDAGAEDAPPSDVVFQDSAVDSPSFDVGAQTCDGVACSGHGECVTREGGISCECNEGYVPQGIACVPRGGEGELSFADVTADWLTGRFDEACNESFDVDVNDFNGDGYPDIVLEDHGSALCFARGEASARFSAIAASQTNTAEGGEGVKLDAWVVDVNGDGFPEIFGTDTGEAGRYVNAVTSVGQRDGWFESLDRGGCLGRYQSDRCIYGAAFRSDTTSMFMVSARELGTALEAWSGDSVVEGLGESSSYPMLTDLNDDTCPDLLDTRGERYFPHARSSSGCAIAPFDAPLEFAGVGFGGKHHVVEDFDRDGDLDLFACSASSESTDKDCHLCVNNGGRFQCTAASWVNSDAAAYWHSYAATRACDFDNDGWMDLVVDGERTSLHSTIYRNLGGLAFEEQLTIERTNGLGRKPRTACADLDDDGRVDLVTSDGVLLANTSVGGHYLKFKIRGVGDNTLGLQATAFVYADGELIGRREVQSTPHLDTSFELHFGLGDARVVDIEVRYPNDGPRVRVEGVAADQTLLVYPSGCVSQGYQRGDAFPLRPEDARCD